MLSNGSSVALVCWVQSLQDPLWSSRCRTWRTSSLLLRLESHDLDVVLPRSPSTADKRSASQLRQALSRINLTRLVVNLTPHTSLPTIGHVDRRAPDLKRGVCTMGTWAKNATGRPTEFAPVTAAARSELVAVSRQSRVTLGVSSWTSCPSSCARPISPPSWCRDRARVLPQRARR